MIMYYRDLLINLKLIFMKGRQVIVKVPNQITIDYYGFCDTKANILKLTKFTHSCCSS